MLSPDITDLDQYALHIYTFKRGMINIVSTLDGNLLKSLKVPESMNLGVPVTIIKCIAKNYVIFISSNQSQTIFNITRLNT